MYDEDEDFEPPVNLEQKIWRYMHYDKFERMLDSRSIYSCRADLLGDKFEGSLSQPTINNLVHINRRLQFHKTINRKVDFNPHEWIGFLISSNEIEMNA